MREVKLLQKTIPQTFAMLTLLALCLLFDIAPEEKTYAATEPQASIENPTYTLTSTNGSHVSTKANPNETTVLIFGHTNCSYTRATLNSISSCNWVKRSDIRVIFAETNRHTQEEVQAYEQGYQCKDMIFCYDESDIIFKVMAAYGNLFNMNGGSYPVIVLIDKNNKVQNLLTGKMTADEILNEIKKFENIDESETDTPPSGSDSGIENIAYGLKSIEGTTVSTKANPKETTVLIFGYTTCSNTKTTLQDIDKSSWSGRSDIRVIFADVYGASLSETKEFSQNYTSGNILFCHDESMLNYNLALSYLNLYHYTGGTFPYIILIDQNNKIQSLTLGPKTAAEIITEIEKFTKKEPSTETPDEKSPSSISNVTGLKAVSSAKKVKLTWNKVSQASGYIIYQYNTSKKTWLKKITLNKNNASYTIKELAPGTSYRFAVKAFLQNQNKKQIISKSYASLYTATVPNSVSFNVTPGKKKVTIKWKKVKGATGYIVYYKSKVKGSWKKLKKTKNLRFTKNKLKSGVTYYFTVKAYKTYKKTTYTSSFHTKKVKIK